MKKIPPKTSKKVKKVAVLKKTGARSVRPLVLAITFTLAALAVIVIGLLSVSPEPTESFLPQEKTVGFLEFKEAGFPGGIQNGEGVQSVVPALQVLTGLPLDQFPSTWWKHPFGVILIQPETGENAWVLFAEGSSRRAMMNDLSSSGLESGSFDSEKKLYTYAQGLNFSFGFSNHHVFISHSQEAIESLKAVENAAPVLSDDSAFEKMQSKLPRNPWLKSYLQTAKVNLPEFPAIDYAFSSMSSSAPQAMMSVEEESRGLKINTFISLLDQKEGVEDENVKEMAHYVPKDAVALFFAGPNLTKQWQKTLTDLSGMNPAYGVILESLVRAQVQNLFGGNVNLRNDLYPLFEGRYATVLSQGENGFSIGMVVEHEDKSFVEVKLDKLLNGFYALVGKLNPEIKVIDLPDGTQSRELVASSQNADKTQEEYADLTLTCLSAEVNGPSTLEGELLRSFCYTTTPNVFYVATSKNLLKQMIDAGESSGDSITSAPAFKQGLSQVKGGGETLTYLDMEQLAPFLVKAMNKPQTQEVKENLEALEVATEEANEQAALETSEAEGGNAEENTETVAPVLPAEPEVEEVKEAGSLLTHFLGQLGQSTWVKSVSKDGMELEGFVLLQ